MRKLKLFFACLLMAVLSIGQVWGEDVSFAFSSIGSTGWSNSYANHSVTCADGTVTMNASKQTTNVTDCPVTKGQPVSFVLSDGTKSLSAVSFTCSQWTTKAQTITLKYSTNGGSSYSEFTPSVTSTNFSISSSSLPEGTNAVQITFSSQSNQVGVASMSYTMAASTPDPSLSVSPATINFGTVEQGADVAAKEVTVNFANLTGDVTYSGLSGAFAATGTIENTGEKITITPNTSVTVGEYEQTLTVTSGTLSKEVTVTMNVIAPFDGEILEIENTDFATSYTNANGDHELGCITITSNQVGNYSSSIQFQKNTGYIYNKTALGEIAKIAITKTGNNNLDVYEGTEENPTTTKITGVAVENVTTYTFSSGKSYFRIFCNNTAASNVTPIKVYYHPTSHAVTLSAGSNGSLTATVDATAITSGDNVEMCKTVAITATPNTGYKIKSLIVTDEDDDEVEVTNNEFVMPAKAVTIAATFEAAKTLTGIEITNPATQTTFWQGVPFNYDGLEVTAHFDGAADEVVTPTSVSGSTATAGENLTVTVSYTEGTTQTAEYTINVKAVPSTAEAPYTVAEARSLYDAYNAASISQPTVYVKGVVTSASMETSTKENAAAYKDKAYNVYVKDAETDGSVTFEFYRMFKDNNSTAFANGDIVIGDTLIANGTLTKYNSTYEFSAGCYMVERKAYAAPKVDISNTKETAYSVATARDLIDDLSSDLTKTVFVKGVVTSVSGSNIFIKDAETDGSVTFEFYNCVDVTGVEENDTIIGTGTLKKHNSTYELDNGCEVVEIKKYVEPAVPSISADPVAVDATEHASQSVTITYENWGTVIVADAEATLWDNEACDEPFSGEWITNVAVAANNESVSFDIAANTGAARTAYMKIYALGNDATTEAEKVIAISQEEYVAPALPAELPFAFDGEMSDIASTQGMSQNGLGSYSSAPKLKFDGTGDWLIINIASDPGKLTYSIKNNSFSGGTFDVQESADGETYTSVASYTEISGTQNEEHNLKQATRFVKFIYTEKSSGNVGLGNIAIAAYVAPAAVAEPTFTVDEGSYLEAQSVEIECATTGAEIHYTLDGNDPDENSTLYEDAIAVSSTTTIKAIAILGENSSTIASATYTIVTLEHAGTVDDPYTVADARTAIDAGVGLTNVYATGIVSEIVEGYNSTYGNISYNISADGETTSDQLQAFRGKNKDGDWFTSENDVKVGDEVVVYGNLKKYNEIYEFDKDNQRYSFTRPGDPVLLSIAISEAPTKTTYDVGNVFDVTGLVVTGTYDQGDPAAIASGITWEVRTNSTSEAVALGSYTLALNQTALQVRATVSAIASEWYDVTGLTVKEHEITPGKYEILLNNALWGSELTGSLSGDNLKDYSGSQNDISFAYNKGTGSNMYFNATQTRLYNGNELVVTAPTGYVIEKVEGLVATVQANAGTITDNVWTGNVNSVTFSHKNSTGNSQLATIYVTFAEYVPATVAAPTFSLAAGEYTSAQSVTIACETEGATIYYTTDNSTPDNTKTQYTGAISVSESMTIKAIAYKDAEYSEVATAAYTINIVVVETPVATDSKWVAATEVVDGMQVLIVGANGDDVYAMGIQNNNNRAAVEGSLDGEGVFTPGDNTMAFTVVEQPDGTFALQTSNGKYLYAASSGSNWLRSQDELDDNGKWTLTVSSAVANGTNTRNTMQFNSGSSCFACYGSASQKPIALYVPQQQTPVTYTINYAAGEGSGDAPAEFTKEEGETFEVAAANIFTAPAGKEFDKWNDGTNDYAPGDIYTVGTSNVVLTAQWKDATPVVTYVAKIGETMYESLPAAVAAAQDGQTVELLMDVAAGPGVMITTAEHKQIIIDFGNHTYCANSPAVGSAGTQNQAFHFEKGCNITLQNGTITSSGDEIIMLIQNYGDLTLLNITLIGNNLPGTHRYVLSNNCGKVVIGEGTTITAKEGDVAFDVCVTNYYPEGTKVTVKDGATITGIVEYDVWGSIPADNKATLTIEGGNFDITWNVEPALAEDAKDNINVEGGIFNAEVPADYCAHGYIPVDNGSGQYGVYYAGYYERGSLTPGNYATICLPYAGKISGASLFDIEYYENSTLYLLEVEGNAMVAGRPYIFLPSSDKIEVTYTDAVSATAGSFNGLVGSLSLEAEVITPNDDNYILYNNQYWYVNSTAYVGANRAYIHMADVPTEPSTPQVGQAPRRRVGMTVHGEQTTTDIDALNAAEAPVKVMINGQLFIIRGEKMYNVNGQLVK